MGTTTVTVGQDTTLIGSKGICLVTLKGGGTKRRGRAQREFCPSRFGRGKGGIFAAAACQLAAFSSKIFQTGRSASFFRVDLGALSWAGEFNVV